ncbi:MAG: GNAT family N-acetyltransferase [Verrucomicrobiota bacterium]
MRELSYSEFKSECGPFDQAVASSRQIARFCSASCWQLAANDYLNGADSTARYRIAEEAGNWICFADLKGRGIWFPLESAWMFGSPLIGDPEEVVDLLRRVSANHSRPSGYCIGGVQDKSQLGSAISSLGRMALQHDVFPATDCMIIDLGSGYESWLSRRSKKFRKTVRVCESIEDGVVIEEASEAAPDILLERILNVQRESYKWREGNDIFQMPEYEQFYRSLIERLRESERLRILFAKQEDQDVGYILGGDFAGSYRGLQMSYADSVRSSSIGNRLQLENIKRCVQAGLAIYDLGMHAEYKERWADRTVNYRAHFLVL